MAAEFEHAVYQLRESLEAGVKSFAEWCAKNWLLDEGEERWKQQNSNPYPGDDYLRGYNDGIRSVVDGAACFLDEHTP